jgi:UDP-glucose 4-epimerase
LVALDNLVDLIITCIDHPKAANQTFLVSDDQDVSTTELLQMMTKAAGKTPRLIPVPMSWLKFVGKLTGKQAVVDRLCGNLQVDIRHTKETLGWTPPITVEEGIDRCFTLVTNS